ncbi:hypothetical protein [Angelakisella massiliensis]|uniref:hypothetical protein n=1 Tax=Angelakisella massiliensis TaxID=1871018 RepID=UPI0024B04D63|nr:hypothetical protein [Angelakisella massiliensis]
MKKDKVMSNFGTSACFQNNDDNGIIYKIFYNGDDWRKLPFSAAFGPFMGRGKV